MDIGGLAVFGVLRGLTRSCAEGEGFAWRGGVWELAAGFGDSAEAGVAAEEEVAGLEGFGLEGGAVGGDEEPVVDLVAEELDAAEGGEVAAEGGVVGRGGFRENEPYAVVAEGGGGVVAQHEDEQVVGVDGEA